MLLSRTVRATLNRPVSAGEADQMEQVIEEALRKCQLFHDPRMIVRVSDEKDPRHEAETIAFERMAADMERTGELVPIDPD